MSQHSIVAPSSSARRQQCHQSTTLEALYPELEESEEAKQGVAAHWAVAEQLEGRLVDVGVIAPNGVAIDETMAKAADLIYDDVVKALAPFGLQPHQGMVEKPVAIPLVHPQSWGTPDYWILITLPDGRLLLFLYDFKYGFLIVDVFENPQLVEYIAGILGNVAQEVEIVAKIVQPRAPHREGPIRTWRTTWSKVQPLVAKARDAAHAALGPSPKATTGPECRDCRARHACEAFQRAGLAAIQESRRVTPLEMTPDAIGLERRIVAQALKLLEAKASALDAQIESLFKSGQRVQGWRVENVEGREKWTRPPEEVIAIGRLLKVNVEHPPEPLTPKQAREAGLDPAIVARISSRARSATKIVEDDGSFTRRIFG